MIVNSILKLIFPGLLSLIITTGICQSGEVEMSAKQNHPMDTIRVSVGKSIISLVIVDGEAEFEGDKIWLIQHLADSLLHESYLGQTDSEYGFYIPKAQPLDGHFIMAECKEYNGIIHLIDSAGRWTKIPGYYFAVQGNYLYTKASGEGVLTTAKYSLQDGKIETKDWNNVNGTDPWNINDDYNYDDLVWLKSH